MSCNKPTTNDFGIREEKKNIPKFHKFPTSWLWALGKFPMSWVVTFFPTRWQRGVPGVPHDACAPRPQLELAKRSPDGQDQTISCWSAATTWDVENLQNHNGSQHVKWIQVRQDNWLISGIEETLRVMWLYVWAKVKGSSLLGLKLHDCSYKLTPCSPADVTCSAAYSHG